jgi:hypothetical protein
MASFSTQMELDAAVSDLWSRRDGLDAAEWDRLYELVCSVLKPYRPKELGSLPEDRQVYIDDFFADKVLKSSASPSVLFHAGAIRVFYRNYLLDQIRELTQHKKYFVSAHRDDCDEDPKNGADQLRDESAAAFAELAEHGLTVAQTAQSAKAFLLHCEAWVPVYLAFNFCPDKPRSETLQALAQRLRIASYHHKASKLGINWDPRKVSSQGKGFADTVLGRWICDDLQLEIRPENAEAILDIFKILCFEALNWREVQEQEATP